jgi:glutamyl-tRNA synthetase
MGHAATFRKARDRARAAGGKLWLRVEDLDQQRCRPEWTTGILEDMAWMGLDWDPFPGDSKGWVRQSDHLAHYRTVLINWIRRDLIYPCFHSRKTIQEHPEHRVLPDGESLFPKELRPNESNPAGLPGNPFQVNWRWRVEDGSILRFEDGRLGHQAFEAGRDFGDFLVWTKAGYPSYEMAVVVDDARMGVTEVVRGADLLRSTARQLLLYQALGQKSPAFFHTALLSDPNGQRLAKRYDSVSIAHFREAGHSPDWVWDQCAKASVVTA